MPELGALEGVARDWLNRAPALPTRLSVPDVGLVDIAAVRSSDGEPRGALVVARAEDTGTDRSRALAEVELAAALISAIVEAPPTVAARQALVGWASTQIGGRTAFAVSIDRLGVTNEVLGYRAGDTILRSLVGRLEAWAGSAGRIARVGGARYLAIRTDLVDEADAVAAAELLRELLAAPVDVDGRSVSRSASIGVAVDPPGSAPAAELLANAVLSGAAARVAGGDEVRRYDGAASSDHLTRLRLELELHEAIAGDQLRMHYQPEYDLRTGRVVAVEALLRWQHPELGLLGADSFVPYSEQTHTFNTVQRWVIDETCRQLAAWHRAGLAEHLLLRVNVSARQVVRGNINEVLTAALERNQLLGDDVCIEITERRMPSDLSGLAAQLAAWRERGVLVAIDDFGTGDGTLSHLLTLPFDAIKIDQTFVSRLLSDQRSAAVVAGVISLARSLQLDVVAEGVDGPDTAAELVRLGCDRGQGNGLAEAMPPEQLEALLRAQSALSMAPMPAESPAESPHDELYA